MKKFIIDHNDANQTLLKFLKRNFRDVPQSALRKCLRNKDVKINDKRIKDSEFTLKLNDVVYVYGLETTSKSFTPVSFDQLKIIHEDDNILVANKPKGIVVHGVDDCLDNQVKSYLLSENKWDVNGSFIPSHCHRLDKWTDGLIIYAKNYHALTSINNFIKDHKVIQKEYVAIVEGKLDIDKEVIGYIFEQDNGVEFNLEKGKECCTYFKTLSTDKSSSTLKCILRTGRKHQIRATLKYLGHPVIGDNRYGNIKNSDLQLTATRLIFNGIEGDLDYLNGLEIKL